MLNPCQALSMGASPTPRWDPEKWHSNTKPKRASNPSQTQSPLTLLASGQNKENNDWRKEDQEQPEQRLGPQRRSFAGGENIFGDFFFETSFTTYSPRSN